MENQESKVNTVKRARSGAHAHSSHAVKRRNPLRPILTFVIIVLGVLLALSVFFRVSKITVDGNSYYTEEQIVQASGIEHGDNMFFVNRFSAASRIFAKLPYVQKVTINRKLPNHVVIEIAESQELGYVVSGDTYWAIDSNGKVVVTGSQCHREGDLTDWRGAAQCTHRIGQGIWFLAILGTHAERDASGL